MVKKLLTILSFIFFLAPFTRAQTFNASVSSSKVSLDQTFQLTFTATGKTSRFSAPGLSDFAVLSGPNQSTSIQMYNGSFSQSISYSYILRPLKAGTFTIEPATIRINGKSYSSKEIKIEVTSSHSGVSKSPSKSNSASKNKQSNNIDEQIRKNLFIKAFVSKSNVYRGEQLVITYKLYQRIEIYQPQISIPKYTGFWAEDVDLKKNPIQNETVDGVSYQVQTFKQAILFPQKTGKLAIEPLTIDGVVRVQSKQNRRSHFDDFFNDPFGFDPFGSTQNYPVTLKTSPITIYVKPLPSPQPLNFSGMVGDFSITSGINNEKIETGNPLTYKITVSGKGNISLLTPFDLDLSSDFESFDPKEKYSLSKTANGLSGSKIFEYLLIPQVKGEYTIPPAQLVYFDPKQGKYVTRETNEINLTVEKGDNTASSPTSQLNLSDKKEIELRGSDIEFIRLSIKPFQSIKSLFNTTLFYVLLGIPVFLLIVLLAFFIAVKPALTDQQKASRRKAHRKARKTLSAAGKMMKKGLHKEFFIAVHKSITTYLQDRLQIPPSELVRNRITEALTAANVPTETIDELFNLLDECEFSKYAPGQKATARKDVFDKAVSLISSIENTLANEKA